MKFLESMKHAPLSLGFTKAAILASSVMCSLVPSVLADPTTIRTNTLAINASGALNLENNLLVVNSGSIVTITNYARTGLYNGPGGFWDGPGINSSFAAVDATQTKAIGVLDNSLAGYVNFGTATGLTGVEILARYTYFGDSDLDGRVTPADYSLIDSGRADFLANGPAYTSKGWVFGDYDYDGAVTPADYSLIDSARAQFLISGAIPPLPSFTGGDSKGSGVVPEPGSLSLIAAGFVGFLGRRRFRAFSN